MKPRRTLQQVRGDRGSNILFFPVFLELVKGLAGIEFQCT